MHSDLTYALFLVIAAVAVGVITLGGTAYAYFAEERWGTKPQEPTPAQGSAREPVRDDEARASREERKQAA